MLQFLQRAVSPLWNDPHNTTDIFNTAHREQEKMFDLTPEKADGGPPMIRYAEEKDFTILKGHDKHICEPELKNSITSQRILVLFEEDLFIGWLRYNLFWDNTPFMNMLYILEEYRGRGYGGRLVDFWEQEMARKNYELVLTSTLSDEQAQFFYRKKEYTDCGSLLLPGEPLEIIFLKRLRSKNGTH